MPFNWEENILLCKQENRIAQKRLFAELWPYLNGVGKRYVFNKNEIQDVLQVTFINIFKSIHQYDASKSAFKTWATKIMINCSLKHNEKNRISKEKIVELKDYDFPIEPTAFATFNKEALMKILKKMPESYYSIFNLFVIDGFSHNEIASILKIDEALSRQRLKRAKDWIRKNFKEDDILSKIVLMFLINMI